MNFLTESQSAWERILTAKEQQQNVVLYGTGNGADKIVDFCEVNKVPIAGIFVSDEFCRGQSFRGHRVESYAQITERLGKDFLLVIAFASELPELLNRFQELSRQHETIAPHLGLYNEDLADREWFAIHEKELTAAYELLTDEWSKNVFQDMLNFKFSGKLEYLFRHVTKRKNDIAFLELNDNEVYYDLGAYDGDTLFEAEPQTKRKAQGAKLNDWKIVAVEADEKNFNKLKSRIEEQGARIEGQWARVGDIVLINKAVWKDEKGIEFSAKSGRSASVYGGDAQKKIITSTTIDAIAKETGWEPSYIKMDVEGAEKEVIAGGAATISRCHPKLFIAAYHFNEDLFLIPLMLHHLNPNYQIFLRKHPYVPDWEINYIVK